MSDVLALLDSLGIAHSTHDHPPVFTVDEARGHWSAIAATHTKNLFLKDAAGRYWLVAMPAEKPLDLKSLPDKIGSKRLRFAPAEQLLDILGIAPGAVSALAVVNDRDQRATLVVDAELMRADAIAFHPLDNRRTTVLAPAGLTRLLASLGREAVIAEL